MPSRQYDREYHARHKRVVRDLGSARLQQCVKCTEAGRETKASDWAQIHGTDGEDPVADYVPLCRPCHLSYDGINNGDPGIGQRRAAQQRAKTHCPKGHEYTPENTYLVGTPQRRQCRTCTRAKSKARYESRRR